MHHFNSLEMAQLFANLNITCPELQLSLYSMFGGRPYPYQCIHRLGLFQGNDTNIKDISKECFASELQGEFYDALQYYQLQFRPELAMALKAVAVEDSKMNQINKASERDHDGYLLLETLRTRYGVIKPCYSPYDVKKVIKFCITEPLLILAASLTAGNPSPQQQDTIRAIPISDEQFHGHVGLHFEVWLREIIEDRRLLCGEAPFPHLPSNDLCLFMPLLKWDGIEDVEITLIASQPSTNTIIYCSCKRSSSEIKHGNLLTHIEKLEAHAQFNSIKELLKLEGYDLKRKYYHVVPSVSSECRCGCIDKKDVHILTLQDLMRPFYKFVDDKQTTPSALLLPPGASVEMIHTSFVYAAVGLSVLALICSTYR